MNREATLSRIDQPIESAQAGPEKGISIWWLGQAGFLIRWESLTIVIDAYLSDALARKYQGQKYPHQRMMAAPVRAEDLSDVDFYISSHGHSDHLDPEASAIVAKANPACRFIMPEAVRDIGIQRGIPDDRIIGVDEGSQTPLSTNIDLIPIPSAHEEIKKDENGRNLFLGYIFQSKELSLYHPGDSLPYPGLDEHLDRFGIDLALMPVNGRTEELSSHGIAGNFNINEAIDLIQRHHIPYMIAHHFGLFDFNTVDPSYLAEQIDKRELGDSVFPAETGIKYYLNRYEQ